MEAIVAGDCETAATYLAPKHRGEIGSLCGEEAVRLLQAYRVNQSHFYESAAGSDMGRVEYDGEFCFQDGLAKEKGTRLLIAGWTVWLQEIQGSWYVVL
jgi:hypothetical protein